MNKLASGQSSKREHWHDFNASAFTEAPFGLGLWNIVKGSEDSSICEPEPQLRACCYDVWKSTPVGLVETEWQPLVTDPGVVLDFDQEDTMFGSQLYWPIKRKSIQEIVFALLSSSPIEQLKNSYALVDEASVSEFINQHMHLLSLLYEAPRVVPSYFDDTKLSLRILADPEDELEQPCLVLRIGTHLSPRDAIKQLGRLQDDWFVPKTMSSNAKELILGVEPIR